MRKIRWNSKFKKIYIGPKVRPIPIEKPVPIVNHTLKITQQRIRVTAPARLHMGFIDLSGALGRNFGGLGVALNEIATRLTVQASSELSVLGPCAARARACVRGLSQALGVSPKVQVRIEQAIPEHIGLGSGTQLALAIGMGLGKLYGLDLGARDIARLADRGARSGIGIGVFEQGGFIVDGGRAEGTVTPPVISRLEVPDDWRFILLFDERGQGLHGQQEIEAFKSLPPFSREQAARLCQLILMQGLPALAEKDIVRFGEVITQIQQAVGDHFAPAQGGRFTSADVGRALDWLGGQGAVSLGQSSWGPTGFCLVEGVERARALLSAAQKMFKQRPALHFMLASARNRGGEIEFTEASEAELGHERVLLKKF